MRTVENNAFRGDHQHEAIKSLFQEQINIGFYFQNPMTWFGKWVLYCSHVLPIETGRRGGTNKKAACKTANIGFGLYKT